ncbi:MAG TPA: amino-acid N-acetyltransferase, partial [Gammaproteobacteria bacterium]|nr:amino-acid N-acetyltransferase [Gammaproteobacteria bacterium]
SLVTADLYEGTRQASIDDVGGILELIEPLEQAGVLVPRSRERLETNIGHYTVVDRDGLIVACAALLPFEKKKAGEIACFAVHPDYRGSGYGTALLEHLEQRARRLGLSRLFLLTTRTSHWFMERGFSPAGLTALPVARRRLYNYQRNAKIYVKAF